MSKIEPNRSDLTASLIIWLMVATMAWHLLDNGEKIQSILNHLISRKADIRIRIRKEKAEFSTRFLKLEPGGPPANGAEKGHVIVGKLDPESGNNLIQNTPDAVAEFSIRDRLCRCPLDYIGISSTAPYYGFIFGIPGAIKIREGRREERIPYDMPEFVSVEFTLRKGEKRYALNVLNYSRHGLGILVTEKDFDLLELLNPGDRLPDVTFFAKSAMIRVVGWVRHKTRIAGGKYQGSYILGIESRDIIESCKQA